MAIRKKVMSTRTKVKTSPEDLFSRVQQKAYTFYEKRGYTHGNDWNDWFKAERLVKSELSRKR